MDAFLFIWLLTLYGVNTAMYLAVTRVAYGWTKTLLGLLVFYAAVAVTVIFIRLADGDPEYFVPLGAPISFGAWLAMTLVLSRRGSRSAVFFEAVLCGAHQLAVSGICHVLMARVRPGGLSTILACALMLVLGVAMIRLLLPHVRRISRTVDWRPLNAVVCILLVLVYSTSIWPIWLAGGSWRVAIPFAFTVVALVSFFPLVFNLSEKSQTAARTKQIEESMRLMTEEVRTRRAAIDEARRVRHDRRHHCMALAELLRERKCDKALAYVESLDDELKGASAAFVWCENETVNAILSGCSRKAQAAHVRIEAEASVPRQLTIPDVELVAVLANLIENAIEAAGHLRSPTQNSDSTLPTVTVRLVCRDEILRFRISNAVPDGFVLRNGLPCETLGVGLRGVRSVMEKYGGGLDFVLENGCLTARGFLSCASRCGRL